MVVLLIAGLAGAVLWLTSNLNARTYRLTVSDGKLVVLKGRLFPVGALPFRPQDPILADAYAPLLLDAPPPADLLSRSFSERDELDRALFGLLESFATPRIASGRPEDVERGLYYLARAQNLAGLSPDQRNTLKGMQADVAFYQARGKLEDAQRVLAEAMEGLRLASTRSGPKAAAARETSAKLQEAMKSFEAALSTAGARTGAPSASPSAPPSASPDAGTPSPGGGAEPLDSAP